MKQGLRELRRRLRLPFWHRADIEAELAAHLQEATAELRAQGNEAPEAEQAALARFGDLNSLADSLQEIHSGWTGGATVQQRFVKHLTLAVIVVCLIAIPVAPPLMKIVRTFTERPQGSPIYTRPPAPAALAHAARHHPDDVFVQLAALEGSFYDFDWMKPRGSGYEKMPDFDRLRQVVSRFDDAPAAHLWLATRLLSQCGPLLRKDARPHSSPEFFRPRTPAESTRLEEAIRHLQRAAALAPDNAAPEFLLAGALFAKHADAQAEEHLRRALGRSGWELYGGELQAAALRLYQQTSYPDAYIPFAVEQLMQKQNCRAFEPIYVLSYIVTGFAQNERAAGRDAPALHHLQVAVRLGDVIFRNAKSFGQANNSHNVLLAVPQSFVSYQEMEQAHFSGRLSPDEEFQRNYALGTKRLLAYLNQHGAAELAQLHQRDLAATDRLEAIGDRLTRGYPNRETQAYESIWALLGFQTWLQVGFALFLLLLAGLGESLDALLARLLGRAEETPLRWSWREWAWLVGLVVLPSYVIQFIAHLHRPVNFNRIDGILALGLAFATGVLLLMVAVIIALLKRRRQATETRPAALSIISAGLRTLLPPTFALLLVLALTFTVLAQFRLQRWVLQEAQIAQQGELQYWKISLPPR